MKISDKSHLTSIRSIAKDRVPHYQWASLNDPTGTLKLKSMCVCLVDLLVKASPNRKSWQCDRTPSAQIVFIVPFPSRIDQTVKVFNQTIDRLVESGDRPELAGLHDAVGVLRWGAGYESNKHIVVTTRSFLKAKYAQMVSDRILQPCGIVFEEYDFFDFNQLLEAE